MNLTSLLCLLRSFLSQLCNFSIQECAHIIHNTYKVGSTVPSFTPDFRNLGSFPLVSLAKDVLIVWLR